MLKFNELRIDEDKNLIVDATVLDVTADPDRTIGIDAIRVGYGSNEDTVDYYAMIPTFFNNLNYNYTYNYQVLFTIADTYDVKVGAVYKYSDYEFKVTKIKPSLQEGKQEIECVYNEDNPVIMTSTGELTKVSGNGDDTVNYDSFTATRVQNAHLRGFRLVVPLANPAIIDTLGDVANTLIYVYVRIDIPADVWEELGNCSNATYIEGYAYDRCLIVNKVFDYLKELDAPCTGISNLANYITQINGLQIAIESNRFVLANKYWTKFFANNQIIGTHSSNCNCCH